MTDDVARARKWGALIKRHGSREAAKHAIRESPEWGQTFALHPTELHKTEGQRESLAVDLMIAADKETRGSADDVPEGAKSEPTNVQAGAQRRLPRHRPPAPIARETVKRVKWELVQRKAKPGDPEHTQEKIAQRLELTRPRIQQAEALEHVGWDLLRSDPDFSAEDGFVRWPSAKKAARLVAFEPAEN